MNYSAKAQFLFAQKLNLALSIQSIQPQDVRINSYDIGAFYESGRFHIEGEYLYKTYADNAYDNVHAVNSFINYDLPLRKVFNKMSFLVRYDMMTSQSDGKAIDEETGALVTTDYKRHAHLSCGYCQVFYREEAGVGIQHLDLSFIGKVDLCFISHYW